MILNFYLPRDIYFDHRVRGHGAGAALPRSMRVDFFAVFLQIFPSFSLFVSAYFPLYCAFISYFCFDIACSLRQAGILKKDKVKSDFHNSIFQVFSAFESFWCPPNMCFRTDIMSIQGHNTGTYKEININ